MSKDSPSAAAQSPEVQPQIDGVELSSRAAATTLTYSQRKVGGANQSGEFGGVYQDSSGRKMLLKHDKAEKDMAEFLSAEIFSKTAPEYSARVELASFTPRGGEKQKYIASIFLDGYEDLFKTVKAPFFPTKDGRTFMAGTANKVTGFLRIGLLGRDGRTPKYEGFSQVMATSLLTGDFDVHTGNVGLAQESGAQKRLVRIDYAGAWKGLEAEIHPHSHSRHPFGRGPTNHYREYPRILRISEEMSRECDKVAKIDLSPTIDEAFDKMAKVYNEEDITKFLTRMGVNKSDIPSEKIALVDFAKTRVKEITKQRQESLKRYGLEIDITLCFDEKGNLRPEKAEKFTNIVKDNREYFEQIKTGTQKLHLRHSKIFPGHSRETAEERVKLSIERELDSRSIELTDAIRRAITESSVQITPASAVSASVARGTGKSGISK